MPHCFQSETERAHTLKLKQHFDSIYDKLNSLCKELSDMDLQTFHCIHDNLIAEVEENERIAESMKS